MSTRWSGCSLLAASMLALAGCAADEAAPPPPPEAAAAPAEKVLLARVSTPTGSTAELWQLEPGTVFFTETGGPGTRPAAPSDAHDLPTVWKAIAPATPMPAPVVVAGMIAGEQ